MTHYIMIYPFKFNKDWLHVEGFSHVVRSSWLFEIDPSGGDDMHGMVLKLKRLKSDVKIWGKKKKQSHR